jgi:hypothetical protein
MSLDDRLAWLVIGCVIGFIVGYLTRMLRDTLIRLDEIKEELDEVDDIVKSEHPDWRSRIRDERGIMSNRLSANIALFVVVVITAYAAFLSQEAVNGLHDTQDRQAAITSCTETYLEETIHTLNVRTQFTLSASSANVDLQKAQAQMVAVLLHRPPFTQARRTHAFRLYFRALQQYVLRGSASKATANKNPYPTDTELNACIDRRS